MQFRLIHSPLLGPSSWAPVADALREEGHEARVPDLRAAVTGDAPRTPMIMAAAAAGAGSASLILVAHSGAGLFMPGIADLLGHRVEGKVFVDAILPPCDNTSTRWPSSVEILDTNTVDGILRPWTKWWDTETMNQLVPNPRDRDLLESDIPRVPRSLYDENVALPSHWCDGPAGYVLLSDAYRSELAAARSRGWPTSELESTHLAPITQAELVASEILRLVSSWS